jgi:hypothetical protein
MTIQKKSDDAGREKTRPQWCNNELKRGQQPDRRWLRLRFGNPHVLQIRRGAPLSSLTSLWIALPGKDLAGDSLTFHVWLGGGAGGGTSEGTMSATAFHVPSGCLRYELVLRAFGVLGAGVEGFDDGGDAAAGAEVAGDFGPDGVAGFDYVVEDLVDDVLLEDA